MLAVYLDLLETPQGKALLAELYDRYHQKLLRIACRILSSHAEAEDAVHETFLKVIEHFEQISEIPCKKQGAWIVTILKNTCLDQLRRRSRTVEEDPAELFTQIPDPAPAPEQRLLAGQLRDAIRQLSAEDRALLERKLVMEWSEKEIAQAMGITVNAVGVRVHRAKKRLIALLEKEGIV